MLLKRKTERSLIRRASAWHFFGIFYELKHQHLKNCGGNKVAIKENRKSVRQRLFLRAFICTPQNNSMIDCIVRDISETGAKLRFKSRPSITDSLELYIPDRGQIAQSRMVWIDNCEVGVSFDSIVAVGTAPSSSDGELSARMARLEDEITALKKLLNRL